MTDKEKYKVTKREFIKTSAAVGAGLALSSHGVLAEQGEEELSGSLRLRTLGRTNLKVTELSFGGGPLRDAAPLYAAIDQGVNLIHTAPRYAGGRSIMVFGEAMKTKRDKVFLALKEAPDSEKVEKALKTLNTDYVDILLPPFHTVGKMNNPELEGAYDKLKKEGKIRFSGYSCHNNMVDVVKRSIDLGFFDVMLVRYNIENKEELDPVLAEAKEKQNMGFMAMKVTKPFSRGRTDEIPGAIKGAIKNRNVHTLLIGMPNLDQLSANLDVLSVKTG